MKTLLFIHLFSCNFLVFAQLSDNSADTAFDFWIGEWEGTWDEGDGQVGKATNSITKTMDGKVIEENFVIYQGQSKGFVGKSLSVYQPQLYIWKQAWVDSQNGYYDFSGQFDLDKRIFITDKKMLKDKVVLQRMVFYNIEENSFTWDWEMSEDGGKNWNLSWRINYIRRK